MCSTHTHIYLCYNEWYLILNEQHKVNIRNEVRHLMSVVEGDGSSSEADN